jgi:hypothetical protein
MAAPRQRMPAARPLPVAADTRRLRQCPRWTAPSGHRRRFVSVADTKHRGSRPVGRTGYRRSPQWTAPRTDRPPQTGGGRCGRPRAGCGVPTGTPEAAPSAHLRWSTGQVGATRADTSVRSARDTGGAFRTPRSSLDHLAQRRLADGGWGPRALRQPVPARTADRRQCPPRSPPEGKGPPLGLYHPPAAAAQPLPTPSATAAPTAEPGRRRHRLASRRAAMLQHPKRSMGVDARPH